MSILVREVMVRDVAYVTIPGSRDDVLRTLQERKVSGVPVIKKGEVVGMITRRDLLRNREEDQTALLMTRDAVVISPDKTVVEAAKLLLEHDIRRLPVVEDKKLVGIITGERDCGFMERDAPSRGRSDHGVCRGAGLSGHRYRSHAGGNDLRPGPDQGQRD
ncbi:MAG: CBS domain-containing protein [Methanosaeta sp. NSM2]|nr:MAG: CBS domain-containing protein [Methanosaeta sp. NSM2]